MYSAHIRRISSAPDVKSFETIPDERTFYNLFVNFNRRQRRFHASLPTVRGTPLNLYSLFTSVVKHGGYSKVTEKDLWETVSKDIGCPSACANYSVALRRVYCHYLVAFENESYPHLKNDSLWSQIQDEFHENPGDVFTPPSVERMLGIFNPKPAPIHYGMHRSATHLGFASRDLYPTLRCNQDSRIPSSFDQLPPSQQLEELHSRPHPDNSLELRHVSVLETAEKSLMSGLPNEVDLSLNSVLFLSAVVHSSPATPLRLSSSRNLLQLMLASVGVYEDGPSSLRPLSQAWNSASNLNFDEFWRDAVGDSVISSLREDAYLYREHSEPLVQDAETAGYRVVPPPSPDTTHDLFSPSPSQARQFFGPTGSAVGNGCGSDDCLSSSAPLSRVLMVVATLVNCVTPPYLPGLPPPLEEDDDEIEQMMAFASMRGRRAFSGSGGLSETGGRPFRGRSLFPAPGLIPPLSAWRENARFLSSQPCALRFAFLCAYARHSALRQLGLQLVSGLRYPLVPTTSTSTAPTNSATVSIRVPRPLHLNTFTGIELVSLRFLIRCLFQSADRCDLLAGLNLLTNLLRVPEGVNVECLFAGLPRSLWCRLIQLLCLSDLGLVCAVLEALYTATGMGGFACTRLWGALASADDTVSKRAPSTVFAARRASIHLRPLLAFLSLEGQSMGPGSLHRVKVMQRQPQPVLTPMQPSAPPPSQMVMGQPVMHYPPPFHSHPHSYHHHSRPAAPPPPLQYLPQQAPRHSPPPTSPQPTPNPHLVPSRPFTLPSQTRLTLPPPRSTSSSPSLASLLGPGSVSSPATATSSGGLAVPPQVANVKPEASSLSELTDRLQMPPPQMPPPRRTSTRVNGAAASSTPSRSPHVNGKISTPLINSLVNHRLPQHHYLLSPRKSSSKSLLEEVLNSPSNKNIPPLVNGCGGGSGSGSTIHHIPSLRNDLVVAAAPSIKLVNGESAPVKKSKQLPVKTEPPLVNGVFHENENVTMRESEEPNKVKVKEESDDGEAEAREEEDDKWMEARLVEVATFFTHYLCFNRRVGFYYTRKRPRNFALRNRVLKGAFSILPDDTAYSCSPTKRRKVDLKSESTKTAMSSQLQQQVQLPPPPPSPPMFVCEWGGCLQRFPVAKQVSCHVYKCHLKSGLPSASSAVIPAPIERCCCQWADCTSTHLPRAPFALMSHVLEHHCSAGELESRRRSIAITSSAPPPPPSYPVSVSVPDQSGWTIIKEVETRRLQSDLWVSQCAISGRYYNAAAASGAGGGGRIVPPPREGPVTKHLRVTAALILRNLAKHVPEARRWLLSETPLLCEIAMGTCPGPSSLRTNDAGRIIAQCLSICTSHNLHDLDDFHSHYRQHYSHRRLVLGAAGDEDTDDCPYCCFIDDDYYNDEDDDYCGYYESSGGRLPLLHRLALLRQRSSVDLDA